MAVSCCRTDIVPTFKQLSSLQAIGKLMTFSNHYITIQSAKLISSCFDLRNILLSNQTNVTWLRIDYYNRYYFSFSLQKLLQHWMYLWSFKLKHTSKSMARWHNNTSWLGLLNTTSGYEYITQIKSVVVVDMFFIF